MTSYKRHKFQIFARYQFYCLLSVCDSLSPIMNLFYNHKRRRAAARAFCPVLSPRTHQLPSSDQPRAAQLRFRGFDIKSILESIKNGPKNTLFLVFRFYAVSVPALALWSTSSSFLLRHCFLVSESLF